MKIKATMLPGQNGTKELLRRYGDQLVCVRYRYDAARNKRLKTVELIVDEQDWVPGVNIRPDRPVLLRIAYGESDLRERVKEAGGYWNPAKKAWVLASGKVLEMGLERRVIDGELDF